MARAVRRINHIHDLSLEENDEIKSISHFNKTKKRKKYSTSPVYKYIIQVPRNASQAKAL